MWWTPNPSALCKWNLWRIVFSWLALFDLENIVAERCTICENALLLGSSLLRLGVFVCDVLTADEGELACRLLVANPFVVSVGWLEIILSSVTSPRFALSSCSGHCSVLLTTAVGTSSLARYQSKWSLTSWSVTCAPYPVGQGEKKLTGRFRLPLLFLAWFMRTSRAFVLVDMFFLTHHFALCSWSWRILKWTAV